MMGGVNNLSDARFAAGWEVDFLGFCLNNEDARKVSTEDVLEIVNWIEGPAMVAEFGYQDPATINALINKLGFDWVLLPGDYAEDPGALHGKIFRKLTFHTCDKSDPAWQNMERHAGTTEFFILEPAPENQSIDWIQKPENATFLKTIFSQYPVFASFPFAESNVKSGLQQLNPAGMYIHGGDEVTPGYRDFDELIDLLEALEK